MSLLLDALKKAAEQKLKNEASAAEFQSQHETRLTHTEAVETQSQHATEESSAPTVLVESDTQYELPKEFDETTTHGFKRNPDATEVLQIADDITTQSRASHAYELPDISAEYDLTLQTAGHATHSTLGGQRETETGRSQRISMTGNFRNAESHYQATPQAAAHMFVSKARNNSGQRARFWVLLGIASLACIVVGGMFIYDYLAAAAEQGSTTYRPRRLQNITHKKASVTSSTALSQDTVEKEVADRELRVEKKDYTAIFSEENRKQPVPPQVRAVAATKSVASVIKKPKSVWRPGNTQTNPSIPQDSLDRLIRKGFEAFQRADYFAAAALYSQAVIRGPENRDAQLGMAAVSLKQNNYPKARQIYQHLLAKNPKDSSAIAGLAAAGLLQSTYARLLDESQLKLMLREQPESHQLNFTLGNLYARQQRWAEAEHVYFLAHRADSENPDYAFNLAVSLEHLGKTKAALQYYITAINNAGKRSAAFEVDVVQRRITLLQSSTLSE